MFRRVSALTWFVLALAQLPVLAQPCTTQAVFVYCTNCPTSYNNCWDSGNFSYSVLGSIVETWCNVNHGNCPAVSYCDEVSMVTAAQDCTGTISLFHGRICCFN